MSPRKKAQRARRTVRGDAFWQAAREVNRQRHPSSYTRPAQVRPTPSSDRNMAPMGRFVHGRAPDESVYSYRARLHAAEPKRHPEPRDPPEPRKRAWLTRGEWEARDAEKRRQEADQ